MKTYVIANRKGGVGKSTTAAALFNWLERTGKRTLLIDLDSQCNVSYAFGIDVVANQDLATIADVFSGKVSIKDVMRPTNTVFGFIVPAAESLVDFDNGSEQIKIDLKTALSVVSRRFDYCIIDAPPSLGRLTVSALLAADYLIIPALADIFSVQGLNSMVRIVETVQQHNKLLVAGILLTRNNDRLVLTKALTEMLEEIAEDMQSKVFKATIREGVAVREAMAQQIGLFEYDPSLKSNVAKDYDSFIRELLEVN